LGILQKIPKPVWRGAKIDRFHRFDLGVHNFLKTGRLARIMWVGWSMAERLAWGGDSGGKGIRAVVLL
jgi:hypothetical protein